MKNVCGNCGQEMSEHETQCSKCLMPKFMSQALKPSGNRAGKIFLSCVLVVVIFVVIATVSRPSCIGTWRTQTILTTIFTLTFYPDNTGLLQDNHDNEARFYWTVKGTKVILERWSDRRPPVYCEVLRGKNLLNFYERDGCTTLFYRIK